ncbi:MAG: hypothetical protein GXP51_02545 [Deltaproteobacteria bacterium]|nr:hypothetical protein [Deltaproteobacteria bacterium]
MEKRTFMDTAGLARVFCALVILLAVVGCEAPLDLQGVTQESKVPVKRFDRFQSVAKYGEILVAVGFNGAILVSNDGAEQWKRLDPPGALDLIEVVACGDGSFVALDATRKVWISIDDGNTWDSKIIDTTEPVTTLTCGPDNKLWVGGSFTTILRSDDKGETWTASSLGEDAMFTSIQFLDAQFGVVSGEFGTVATSKDGGETWEIGPSMPNDFYPEATLFLDHDNGYAVGLNGKILKTTDGGISWTYEDSGTDAPLYGITTQGEDLYVVGEGGVMLHRKADRWERVQHGKPVRSYLRSVLPVNDRQLLIAGGAGALFLVSTQN